MFSIRQKLLKSAISAGLVIALMGTILMPASLNAAADTTTSNKPVTLSLKTIETMTADGSLAIKLKDVAIKQILEDYYSLDAQVTKLQKLVATAGNDATRVVAEEQLLTAKTARDAKWKAYSDAREDFSDVIGPTITSIKLQYMGYVSALIQEDKLNLSIKKAKKSLDFAQKKLELKYISQSQFDSLQDAYDKLISSQDSIIAQRATSLEKLFNALSLGGDSTVASPEMMDVKTITKLDFATSLQSSLTKNKEIKDAQDDYNDARLVTFPYYNDDNNEVKVAKIKLTGLQNARTESFTANYEAMQAAAKAYFKNEALLQKNIKKASQMETKYKLGYISKNQLDTFNDDLESEKLQLKLDNYSLMSQYISFQSFANGY